MHWTVAIVREQRKKRGLSQAQLSLKAGLGWSTVGRWEKSLCAAPQIDALEKVLKVLNHELEILPNQ